MRRRWPGKLGKPVKCTETRSESLMAAHHGRDQMQDVTLAAKRDGTVTGLKVELLADMGAYLGLVTPGDPDARRLHVQRDLQVPGATSSSCTERLHQQDLTDAYRGAGRPEATFAIERIDGRARRRARTRPDGAARAELDQARGVPVHHGRRAAPTTRATTRPATAEGHASCSATTGCAASRSSGASAATRSSSASASRRTPRCAGWPRRGCSARWRYVAGGWEHAAIRMLPTGKVEVVTGTRPHGQGHETAWSQIVADQLGVPFEDVEVLHGDTQVSPQGPGHLRLALAGRRRHGGGQARPTR